MRPRLTHFLLFVLVFSACARGEPSSRDVTSGQRSVRGSALSVGTDSIVAGRVFRIGELDGPPEYAFGQIATITPAPDGGFYVCDGNDQLARRYDEAGRFIRVVGRKGAGPGEYDGCYDMDVGPDSGLVVSDPYHGRLVVFGKDDAFVRVVPAVVGGGLRGEGAFFIDDAGRYWRRGWEIDGERAETSEQNFPVAFSILDRDGSVVGKRRVPSPGQGPGRGFALCTNDGCYSAQPVDSMHSAGPNGSIVVASPMAYRILVLDSSGTAKEVTRDAKPVAYADAEFAEWEAWREYFTRQTPQYPPVATPRTKPLIRDLRIDDIGRVWVKVHVTAEKRPIPPRKPGDQRPLLTWRERNTFDLFDAASGGYIGRIAFPYATEFMASRGDRVWLREEGESGEQLIGVYDLKSAK